MLIHTTKASGLTVAAAMDHRVDGPPNTHITIRSDPDLARVTITATVAPGSPMRVMKFVGYSWSGERTVPAVRDQVDAALAGAVETGWEGLLSSSARFLTRSGRTQTSRSMATRSSSRPPASRCSTPCRRGRAANSA